MQNMRARRLREARGQPRGDFIEEFLIRPGLEVSEFDFFLKGSLAPVTHQHGFALQPEGGFGYWQNKNPHAYPNPRTRPVSPRSIVNPRRLFFKNRVG